MGGLFYNTKAGDTWDYIAWKVYGSETALEQIMQDEKNSNLLKTTIFADNVKVWCPLLEETVQKDEDEDTPPWRDNE